VGRLADAEASYRQAILLKPDWDNHHYNFGIFLFEGKRYDLAAEQLEQSDIPESKLYAIKCLYLREEKAIFHKKLIF
jgi:Tfp pilus assembly protein PilF